MEREKSRFVELVRGGEVPKFSGVLGRALDSESES